jgi:hypothetical protein
MFWLRNRQRDYWQAKAEAPTDLGPDMYAMHDAAVEQARHDRD